MADTKVVITAETSQAQRALQSLGDATGTLATRLSALPALTAFAPAAAVAGIVAMGKAAIDTADNLNDLSQKYGVGVKELTSYQLIAEQSGTTLDSVAAGLKGLSKNLAENSAALKAAGVDTSNTTEAMRGIADLFASMPDGAEKTTLAMKLFGKAGADLIPMLNGGSKALADSAQKTAKLGELYEDLAPKADQLNDQLSELGLYVKAFGANIASFAIPALNQFIDGIAKAAAAGQGFGTALQRGLGLETLDDALRKSASEIERVDKLLFELSKKGGKDDGAYGARITQLKQYRAELLENAKVLDVEAEQRRAGRASSASPAAEPDEAGRRRGSKLLDSLGGDDSASKKAATAAAKQAKDEADAWVKSIDAQIDAERDLAQAQAAVAANKDKEIQKYRDLADPAAKYRLELERIAELGRTMKADGSGFELSADQVKAANDAINEQIKGLEKTNDIGRQLGLTFSSAFEDAIVGGKDFRDVLKGMAEDLVRLMVRKNITEPGANYMNSMFGGGGSSGGSGGGGNYGWVGGVGSALGSMFSGSEWYQSFMSSGVDGSSAVDLGGSIADYLASFAKGDAFNGGTGLSAYTNTIVSSPTLFKFARGGAFGANTGLMGEAGSEAIMPLTRTSSGHLGVRAIGGGSGGGDVSVVVNVDASGSSTEGGTENAAELGRKIGAVVRSVLVEEKRPGGMLAGA